MGGRPPRYVIVVRPRLGTDPHPESHRLVQPIQRFVAFATKCAGPRNASGARSRADTNGQSLSSDLTRTIRGSEAIPFATTSSLLGPDSWFAGTSKCVDTTSSEATAMLVWSWVRL
jgi:hypothetical protein